MRVRSGIAMIELIFAIVVMGIVMMSAPMLIEQSSKSSYVALQQESIMAAATQISAILMQEWDHNDANSTLGAPVLQVSSTSLQICNNDYPLGVTDYMSGRYCIDNDNNKPTASNIVNDSNYSGIDDFNGNSAKVLVYNNEVFQTYQGDYIDQNITIVSTVAYGNDAPSGGSFDTDTTFDNPFVTATTTTNIKLISVVLTSNNTASELSDKNIRLSAFMCNIGEPKQFRTNE